MKLQRDLLLFEFITDALGGDFAGLTAALKDTDPGRRGDGQSYWFGVLEGRASKFRAPLDLDALRRYDLNILAHEARLAGRRGGFRLKFFQYLALLYTEVFLDRLVTDRARLLLDLEGFRTARLRHQAPMGAVDLFKLAFWMATGSGKTLLLHINYLQFLHYRPFKPANCLLLAPSRGLAEQHLKDLAQSGLPAAHALTADPGFSGIQVLEITKLYRPQPGQSGPRSGESLPTDQFEGPNLLLVDEGHKGTATKSDAEEERAWRTVREALAENGGFTIEYSATFAQVAEVDPDLHAQYARSILFDYAYRSFHGDGYGKDFWVANLDDQPGGTHQDLLLMGGLLAFYQQRRCFQEQRAALQPYLIEAPLMVFIGDKVSAGRAPEVLRVIRFLDRVCGNEEWAADLAERVLSGASGLDRPDGADCFADRFPYLQGVHRSAAQLVADLRRDLFQGTGGLSLHLIRRAEGEIGMRTRSSPKDGYCGVVNVGDAASLLKRVVEETAIPAAEEDALSDSLFRGLDAPESPIAFLVGSKKFLEGWSSWRVSTMGLLKVGQNAGAQVLQLFGRGVRLKGSQFSMRRSSALPGTHPGFLPLLETLNIFGLRARYLATFLNTLRREDLEPPVVLTLPIAVRDGMAPLGLKYPRVRQDFDFRNQTIRFEPARLSAAVTLNLMPQLGIGDSDGYHQSAGQGRGGPLSAPAVALLPMEDLYRHALAHKARKDWGNLYVPRSGIETLLRRHVHLSAPVEVLNPRTPTGLARLTQAARVLIEKGIDRFYLQCQRAEETRNAQLGLFDQDHPNVPRIGEDRQAAYELRVPPRLVAAVKAIIEDEARRLDEETHEPLPRLHLDQHLYQPLLLAAAASDPDSAPEVVKSVPAGLVNSERRFVLDLRGFWNGQRDLPDWNGVELFLMRNLPRTGIGFFQTGGFFPDFLLWMRRGDRQALAFIEPHGIVHQEAEKLDMLGFIRGDLAREVELPLFAFIVSDSTLAQVKWLTGGDQQKRDGLRAQHVLLMDDADYLDFALGQMRAAVASEPAGATRDLLS